jgi:pyruvate ferredoxin oxidoreductase gamma subunit
MFRIRLHGRGGQGIKSASRVLGTAFYAEGFQVQDAPRYGAERRGAPVFAYVRADRRPIHERGVIVAPGLVLVADDTLVGVPAAGVLQGIGPETVVLIDSDTPADDWRRRLAMDGPILVLPRPEGAAAQLVGAACAGAAARLVGVIGRAALADALDEEYGALGAEACAASREVALEAYDRMAPHQGAGRETEGPSAIHTADWIELPFDAADVSAPAIHAPLTSVRVRTGLWRTMRPVIDRDRCKGCWWVCSTYCPDDCISVTEQGLPEIDYQTCKGCMICVAQCPPHAIEAVVEADATAQEEAETP